ncbi:uncharacterized protein LOC119658712 isoform X1 [Hermetia illucens]|uniref:uncharacterized protein LOC119658712 isoform X1 n=1 Tax=Hermetia illucens TaxID=343691 RepID=UPI0018CC202A|nr:uncharacterized protein LOC119658712 isoform X1 [Hermetia illucens]
MSDQTSESSISEYLNDGYIHKILNAYEKQEVEILKYEVESATKKGENFASSLSRLRMQYCLGQNGHTKTLTTIVKSRLGGEVLAEIESEFSIFDRESQVYKIILGECEDMLKSIGDDTHFGPRAIYVDDRIIVLEDLKEQGYTMENVRKGLNKEHCSRILEKLAKFHATTRVLYCKKPELFKYHIVGNIGEVRTPLHTIYENTIETCTKFVSSKEDLSQYANKLETYGKDIIKKLINIFSRDPNGFNVLNHGDMWVNNFLFKSDGKDLDVLFVDFQEGFFGSPGIDFNYFIYSSWSDDVFRNHRKDLIKLYLKTLQDTLKKLGDDNLPSLEIINKEIHSKGDHGLITACCMYPILTTDHPDLADPAIFVLNDEESKETRMKVFDSNNYYNHLKLILPEFVESKFL